jgi:cytochrome P450 family 135
VASATPPPGLPWHPLRQTVAWIRRPQETLDRCVSEFGDAFTLRMFGQRFSLFAEPELIKELLAVPSEVLSAGRANAFLSPLVGNSSVLVLDGDEHLAMRRLQLPPLHGDRMRSYEASMRQVAEESIARWPLEGEFRTWPRMQSITLRIIVRVIFGIEDPRRSEPVREAVGRLLKAGTRRRTMVLAGVRSAVTGSPIGEGHRVLRKVTRARDELGRLLDLGQEPATDRWTTSNSSSADADETGRARSPECASIAGPLSHAWNDSSESQCVTTK